MALFLLLCVLLVAIELTPVGKQMSARVVGLTQPIERGLYVMSSTVRGTFYHLLVGGEVADKIASLEGEVARLAIDRARFEQLTAENDELRSITGFQSTILGTVVPLQVIGFDPRAPKDLLRLDGGRQRGIAEGSAVVTINGNLIGVIADVGEQSSVFRLLSGSDLQIPARVPAHDGAFGILASPEGLSLTVQQIPKTATVTEGDVVVTGIGFPGLAPNIPIGSISSVRSTPEELWQKATLQPFATSGAPDIVSVIVLNDGA